MEGYLKWSKILNILFYIGIAVDIAFLIYIILSKNFSNLLPFGLLVVFTIAFKPMSKKMKEIYDKNPDAEIVDIMQLNYKANQYEKKLKQDLKNNKNK